MVVTILLLLLLRQATADVNLVGLLPPVTETDPYFPQVSALGSAMRLAAQHVNDDGTLLVGDVTISLENVASSGSQGAAAAALCSSLLDTGSNSTNNVAVRVYECGIGDVGRGRMEISCPCLCLRLCRSCPQ